MFYNIYLKTKAFTKKKNTLNMNNFVIYIKFNYIMNKTYHDDCEFSAN